MSKQPSMFELFNSRVFIYAIMFGLVGWLLDFNYLEYPYFYVLFSLFVVGGSYFDYKQKKFYEEE